MNWRIGIVALALALPGCGGGVHSLTGENPVVRTFNAVNGSTSLAVVLKDTSGNVLGSTPAAALGTYSGLPDASIPNTNAAATLVSSGSPVYTSASSLYRINSTYTLVAGGSGASHYVIAMNDDQQDQTSGNIGFRAVHAGTNQASVDVYLLAGAPTTVTGAAAVFSGVGLGVGAASGADGNGYATEPLTASATYSVLVTPRGSTTVIASASITLYPRVYYSAIVYDSGNNTQVAIASDRF